ncbi:MAG: Crp/Fnr family transcriptional regulator [Candidatus Cyclobacteriaceae bacterium M3_2C_046]
MIDEQILSQFGARETHFAKDEILFIEGDDALYYWQIICGSVKMVNYSPDGQEFTQGIFHAGESFGEPPLFADFTYPSHAVAIEDSQVFKLPKSQLINLLKAHFDIHWKITYILSKRLQYKSMIMRELASHPPEHRILSLIDHLKVEKPAEQKAGTMYEIPFTRQQIADMTGLRVETVIRSIKSLEEKGKVQIINRKVYRKI